MPLKDIHTRIVALEARIAKLESIKRKATEIKATVKKNADQKKAKELAQKLRKA